MVGIVDIAPVRRFVETEGQRIDVPGVSAEGLAYLLSQFPQFMELRQLIGASKDGSADKELSTLLFAMGPKMLHEVLAAGCGYPGDPVALERVAEYDLTTQADLLDAILSKTLSKGLDHFLGRLTSIKATLSPPATLADKVREASRQKRKLSPEPSSSSSEEQVTQNQMSGA